MYLGSRPVVILWGTEAIREALVDQAETFSGRAQIAVVDQVFQGYGKGLKGTGGWELGVGWTGNGGWSLSGESGKAE